MENKNEIGKNKPITTVDNSPTELTTNTKPRDKKKLTKTLFIIFTPLLILLSLAYAMFYFGLLDNLMGSNECEYNGETYIDREIFDADDGCNTCYCDGTTGEVTCTEIDCDAYDIALESNQRDESEDPNIDSSEDVTEPNLPSDIYPEQIYKEYEFDGVRYLTYRRSNMNIPIDDCNDESGILYANTGDIEWKHFAKINELGSSKNNAFILDYVSNQYFILIIDANGAGSGEGIAKLLRLGEGESEWELLYCFYYIPENWNLDSIDNLKSVVEEFLQNNPQYEYNSTSTNCNNFELEQYI